MPGLPLTLWLLVLAEMGGGELDGSAVVAAGRDWHGNRLGEGVTQNGGRGVEGSPRPAITERKAK